MIDFIVSHPALSTFLFGFVLTFISANIAENPRRWKMWKYTNYTVPAGVLIMVLGLGVGLVS